MSTFGDAPTLVVGDDHDKWQLLAGSAFEIGDVEGCGTVPRDQYDTSHGIPSASGHSGAYSISHDTTGTASDHRTRIVVSGHDLVKPLADISPIYYYHCLRTQHLFQGFNDIQSVQTIFPHHSFDHLALKLVS